MLPQCRPTSRLRLTTASTIPQAGFNGKVIFTSELASRYGFTDVDGRIPGESRIEARRQSMGIPLQVWEAHAYGRPMPAGASDGARWHCATHTARIYASRTKARTHLLAKHPRARKNLRIPRAQWSLESKLPPMTAPQMGEFFDKGKSKSKQSKL